MAWASLSRLVALLVAKLPVKMWVIMVFVICFRLTALDMILKISESLAARRAWRYRYRSERAPAWLAREVER